MRLSILFISLLLLGGACGTKHPKKTKQKGFIFASEPTIEAVLAQAAAQNKMVFVDVYTTWCLPCKLMDEEVFVHQSTADFYNDNFINYKVNAESEVGLPFAQAHLVRAYPTLLFLDSQGNELLRKEGAAFQTEMMTLGQRVLDEYQPAQ